MEDLPSGLGDRCRYPACPNMHTRYATVTDAAAISAFVSEIAAEHISPSLGDGGIDKLLASMNVDATEQRIADNWPHICALDGDCLTGVVVVKPPTHLYHLFVRTDLQRNGLGTKLLAMADDWCVNKSGIPLATVNSSLNAVHVYRRFGFDTDGPVIDTGGVKHQPMVRPIAG